MLRARVDFQKVNFLLEDTKDSLVAEIRRIAEANADRFLAEAEQIEGTGFDPEFKHLSKAAMTHPAHDNPAAPIKDKQTGSKLHADAAQMARRKGYTSMEKYHRMHQMKIDRSLEKMSG